MKHLEWQDMKIIGEQDSKGRWWPCDEIEPYFVTIRTPSSRWPNSYAKAAQTVKFAQWLAAAHPALYARLDAIKRERAA